MGAIVSKSSDAPQLQFSETRVIHLLEAQRQEYERKLQEQALEAASLKKLLKEALITQRKLEKKIIATKKLLKEESSKIELQNEKVKSSSISNRESFHASKEASPQKKVPCPHIRQGCKLNISLAALEIHVQECPFKEHNCPVGAVLGKCNWQGGLSGLSRHIGEIHPNCFVPEVGSEFRLRYIQGNHRYVRLIGKDGFFVFHAKISETDGKMYIKVQLLGMKESAMKCNFRIHLENKRDCHRNYENSDRCCSIRDNIADVFQKNECLVLPMRIAKTFIYNGALYMKIFIDYPPL